MSYTDFDLAYARHRVKLDIARVERYYGPVQDALTDLRAAEEMDTSVRWRSVTGVQADFEELRCYLKDIQQHVGKRTLQRAALKRTLRCVMFE